MVTTASLRKRVKLRSTAASATDLLSQSPRFWASSAGAGRKSLPVLEYRVGDLLEEAERHRDPGPLRVGQIGLAAQRARDNPHRVLQGSGRRGEVDQDAAFARHAPQIARQIDLLGLGGPRLDLAIELVDRGLIARLELPAQPIRCAADSDLRAVAEALDLVAQVALDDQPHRLEAEFGERGLGVVDRLARQGEGERANVLVVIAPAVGQQFVAAARHPLEVELLGRGTRG
jgi:hypothetical protein